MPYAFIQDVPANEHVYAEVRARLGDSPPKGLISHVVVPAEGGGLRYIDLWDSAEDWERFREEQVEPVVGEVLAAHGLPLYPSLVRFEELRLVDAWVGDGR